MIQLREYQRVAIEKGVEFFRNKKPAPSLIVAPTAAGKSLITSGIAKEHGHMIVLQPSKELLEQNYNKLLALGGEASIFSASMGQKEIGEITYATIGSIAKHPEKFRGYDIVVDEAHLYPRETGGMLRKFIEGAGIKKILGTTATAFKLQTNTDWNGSRFSKLQMLTSRSGKGNFFKDIIYVVQIQDIIEQGYWAKLEYDIRRSDTSRLNMNSTGAEYDGESIRQWYENNDIENRIIKCLNKNDTKHVLVFVPSIKDAQYLANLIDCVVVYSGMPDKERAKNIDLFRSGMIRTAVNVNILGTGFDYQEIDHIIVARPTASLAMLYQWLGRGTRIHPDKEKCLITDFGNNILKFGPIEELYYSKHSGQWQLYGHNNKQLTNIPI